MPRKLMFLAWVLGMLLSPVGVWAGNGTSDACAKVAECNWQDGLCLKLIDMAYLNERRDFKKIVGFGLADPYDEDGQGQEVFTVVLLNGTGQTIPANPHHLRAVTKSGRTLEPSTWTFRAKSPFPAVNVSDGNSVEGVVAFPRGEPLDRVVYDDGVHVVGLDASNGLWLAACMSESVTAKAKAAKKPK